jgi:type I restriction enzyme M protein
LPTNLFYGTGIPACIIVLDKENATHRKGIFMMDASKGFIKDGNKNRLREQDLRKITDVFTKMQEVPKYSRMVPMSEIADAKNDYNLNIPRYIDTQGNEDIQDLQAHLQGGIPVRDLDEMKTYWSVYPNLKNTLFSPLRDGYVRLNVASANIKTTIFNHEEFKAFNATLDITYNNWLSHQIKAWKNLTEHSNGKELITQMSESLLKAFESNTLIEAYDLYQYLMVYWQEIMQDDIYSVSLDGWKAGNEWTRLVIKGKKDKDGKPGKDKEITGLAGVEGRLISPELIIEVYFKELNNALFDLENQYTITQETLNEIEEENAEDDSIFGELDKINLKNAKNLYKERKAIHSPKEELNYIKNYIDSQEALAGIGKLIKIAKDNLETKVIEKYPTLTEDEIKNTIIQHKWKAHLLATLQQEQDKISQGLTQRINILAERYETTLSTSQKELAEAETKVVAHLHKMGLVW